MAAPPRPSASVVLLRSAGTSWETYLLHRSGQAAAFAGLWVFPGGTLRSDDYPAATGSVAALSPLEAHTALSRPPGGAAATPDESLAYFVGAARELFEEAGVLLTTYPPPQPSPARGEGAGFTASPSVLHAIRAQVREGLALADAAAQLGLELALNQLIYYAHWITPEILPQRFDTRFFLTLLPDGQEATPDAVEVTEGLWIDPAEALERSRAGRLPLHFATVNHLRRLAPYRSLGELMTFARTKPVAPITPSTRGQGDRYVPFLPPELEGAW